MSRGLQGKSTRCSSVHTGRPAEREGQREGPECKFGWFSFTVQGAGNLCSCLVREVAQSHLCKDNNPPERKHPPHGVLAHCHVADLR